MPKHDSQVDHKKSAWSERPDYRITIAECAKPMRVVFNGVTLADSRHALLLKEQDHATVVYFPRDDVRMEMFTPIAKTTFCPFKGEASHWALQAGTRHVAVAAWSYETPFNEVHQIKDHIAFYPEAVEQLDPSTTSG